MTHTQKLVGFEEALRQADLPYVLVDEAKKALLGKARMDGFDCIVYRAEGDEPENLLVDLCQETRRRRDIMARWQDIFGKGFVAVFAEVRDSAWVFRTLEGDIMDQKPEITNAELAEMRQKKHAKDKAQLKMF